MESLAILALVGSVAGLAAGLLGIGGGIITVPALYFLLPLPHEEKMLVAVATSLAATFMMSTASAWGHAKRQAIDTQTLSFIAPGLLLGCMGGAYLSLHISADLLQEIFGWILLLLSVHFLFPKLISFEIASSSNPTLVWFGMAIGTLSSLLGIGGGVFTVPVLIAYQLPSRTAIATSAASTWITTGMGSLAFLALRGDSVDLLAFIAITAGALFTVPIGVYLTHYLPVDTIKRLFGIAVFATGLGMVLS